MKTHYRILVTCKVDGAARYSAGDIVPKSAITPGTAASMLRLGQIEEVDEPKPEPKPAVKAAEAIVPIEAKPKESKPAAKPESKK